MSSDMESKYDTLKYQIFQSKCYSFLFEYNRNVQKIIDVNLRLINSYIDSTQDIFPKKKTVCYVTKQLLMFVNRFSYGHIHLRPEHYFDFDLKLCYLNKRYVIYIVLPIELNQQDTLTLIKELDIINTSEILIIKDYFRKVLKKSKNSYLPIGMIDILRRVDKPFLYKMQIDKEMKITFILTISDKNIKKKKNNH